MLIFKIFFFGILLCTTALANNRYTFESMFLSTGKFGLNSAVLVNDSCVIVCGDKGSIKRSSNRGKAFDLIRYKYYYDDLSGIAMNGHGEIFCSTRSGNLIKSTDQGLTWQEIKLDYPSPFRDIDFWDNLGLMATDDKGVMLTLDYGNTWKAIDYKFPGVINSIRKLGDYYYVACSDGTLYKSSDGENWIVELSGDASCNSIDAIDDDRLLIGYDAGRIIEYTPAESKTIELPKLGDYLNVSQVIRLNDSTNIVLATDMYDNTKCQKYNNNNDEWNYLESTSFMNKIYYSREHKFGIGVGSSDRLMIGTDTLIKFGALMDSKRYGNYVKNTDSGSQITRAQFVKLSAKAEDKFIATSPTSIKKTSILVSKDSCQSFEELVMIDSVSKDVVFAVEIEPDQYVVVIDSTKYEGYNSSNLSRIYTYSQNKLTQVYETEWNKNIDKYQISDSVFIFYKNVSMYVSKNYGIDWEKVDTPEKKVITQLFIDKDHILHASVINRIYTSSDYGTTWKFVDSVSEYINCFEVLDNGQYLRVASSSVGNYSPYSLYINDPNTKEWKSIYEGVVNSYYSCFNFVKLKDGKEVLISNNDIVLISNNYTKCERLNGNRPFYIFKFLNSVKINDNTIYLCAPDSIYRIRLSLDSTAGAVTELINDDITIDSQASSDAVTIRSTDAKVLESIEVFDQNGLSVARINNIQSDSYKLNTETLSAGLYLIKIKSDGKEFLKKILKY